MPEWRLSRILRRELSVLFPVFLILAFGMMAVGSCFSLASIIFIVSVVDGIYILCTQRPARLWEGLAGEHGCNNILYSMYYHTIHRGTHKSVP